MESPNYTLKLLWKSDFQPSNTKPDNIGHLTVKHEQIWLWDDFQIGFVLLKTKEILIRSKKNQN